MLLQQQVSKYFPQMLLHYRECEKKTQKKQSDEDIHNIQIDIFS